MNGHLFFIMGVSGSGKGTLKTNLIQQDISNLEFLKSYVTRAMRPGEKQGDTYNFISEDIFKEGIKNNEFLEYEINHGTAYYGTKKSDIDNGLVGGKILMKEIDTKGLKQISEKHPTFKKNYTSFFLDVPNSEMKKRYFQRHPEGSLEDIENRLLSSSLEREQAQIYCDHIIDASQSQEDVLQEVLNIMGIQ